MLELLPAIEKDVRDISARAGRTLGLLTSPETPSAPALYQEAMQGIFELHEMWQAHRKRLSRAFPLIVSYDPHFTDFIERIERDAESVGQTLEALSSAGWARHPAIGVHSIRVRGMETLSAIVRQLESERITILPLLRRWASSPKERLASGQLASA